MWKSTAVFASVFAQLINSPVVITRTHGRASPGVSGGNRLV